MMATAAFTGHRFGRFTLAQTRAVRIALSRTIERAKERGITEFISGMAIGVDQWAAELVLDDPELRLICAIPCHEQYKRWSKEWRERWESIIARAHQVEYVHEGGYYSGCLNDRNKWMVDRADVAIAIWDGGSGGTAHCVRYAQSKPIPVWRFNPVVAEYSRC